MVPFLLGALALIGLVFASVLVRTARARGAFGFSGEGMALGAVTNFFDTLGIGSFAPTTAWIKLRKLVPDSYLPAVLNVGHALPSIAQALVFITLVKVDPKLLVACIAAAVVGALIGAPVVTRMPVRAVQTFVGIALLIAAVLYAMTNLGLMPAGGDALSLPPTQFAAAVFAHFILGALMTAGIGMYAPSLVLLSLMGLNPEAVFPIMMGSCAFLMPSSGFRFLKSDRIDFKLVLSLAAGGIPAVLLAAYVVKSLPLEALRWGVVVVVLYTAVVMLRSAMRPQPTA
ncbi:sulfite exporter TauE/SafE family protein [Polymorphobacter arshaanensis]|uniref:Probable membrane transporter protein n=2 Tax=Glacieibacterium arshaanense TaxID=2511025 RepID=A0A4Y9ERU3_9SPHN|nr:sulfite exporter TauE/SafE family protein [Polymorphobacter arshaanensis]